MMNISIPGIIPLAPAVASRLEEFAREHCGLHDLVRCFAANRLTQIFFEMKDQSICRLHLDSGESEFVCHAMEAFHSSLTEHKDAEYFSGNALVKSWEILNHQSLSNNERLIPKAPLVLGTDWPATDFDVCSDMDIAIEILLIKFQKK